MMHLYLVRHGQSLSAEIDPEQSLSDLGKEEVYKIADFFSHHPIEVDHLVYSVKKRAKQTAEILLTGLKNNVLFEEKEGLKPNDLVEPIADWAQLIPKRIEKSAFGYNSQSIMIVSHLPFLSRLASHLLIGDPNRPLIDFGPVSICSLKQVEGVWILQWCMSSELVLCAV